ncbi:hypothetical protein G4B88_022623 [Cannabis sativa]|uniref:F-box protein n=1 Tax=Cannabis sativa TaxID=3483 RepID=A0A7J6HYR3_CANSA|nr:hypothetical protein G4B88_022623 [Cannabis sativa]
MWLKIGTESSTVIVAFDLIIMTEKYNQLPLANKNTKGKSYYSTRTVLDGWFVIKEAEYVEFWVKKEYGVKEFWTKLCTVVTSNVTGFL